MQQGPAQPASRTWTWGDIKQAMDTASESSTRQSGDSKGTSEVIHTQSSSSAGVQKKLAFFVVEMGHLSWFIAMVQTFKQKQKDIFV